MPQGQTLALRGYREFLRASDRAGKESKAFTRETFRQVGERVREDAAGRMRATSSVSAAGYRTRVRARGISVEQSLRKTTGRNPAYGAYQMREALVPALEANEDGMMRDLDRALGLVERHFEKGPGP